MPNQHDKLITMTKNYMITEWPALSEVQLLDLPPKLDPKQLEGMLIAYWRVFLAQRQRDHNTGLQAATLELEHWI